MRPERPGERLVVRHHRGHGDEEDRREEDDRGRDQQRVVRDREQEPAATDLARELPPLDGPRGEWCRGGAHRKAPW